MAGNSYSQKSYFELSKHNFAQIFIFALLLVLGITIVFAISLPLFQKFFEGFLGGRVFNSGEKIGALIDSAIMDKKTNYLYLWGVDIYINTPSEARYWFNPILSLVSSSLIIGMITSVTISSLLPLSSGYMRQKIDREIANLSNKISANFLESDDIESHHEIINMIKNADMRLMYEYVDEWGISIEDIKILQRALIWQQSNVFYKILHINDGITMYMRFYFTIKYGNAMLGFVYMGAAVLIIIVGLRGLKFVPPTQPSIVLFALGLEFTLLITYALNLIYGRQDEEGETVHASNSMQSDNIFMSSDFGSSREIEKLLRVFIKSNPKKTDKK